MTGLDDRGAERLVAPYVSLLVVRSATVRAVATVAALVKEWLVEDQVRSDFTGLIEDAPQTRRFHYCATRRPSWLKDDVPGVEDRAWHVVMVTRRGRFFAVHCSEPQAAVTVTQAVGDAGLAPIPPPTIERALARGQAKTLWLQTVRRSSEHRADRKTLAGDDLELALDPLEDQGYTFSSARCRADGRTVGISPGRARVWTRRATDAPDFDDRAGALLESLSAAYTAREQVVPATGFRARLAETETSRTPDTAFEVTVGSTLLDTEDEDDEALALARELAEDAELTVENPDKDAFELVLERSGVEAPHRYDAARDDAQVTFTCAEQHGDDPDCTAVLAVLNDPDLTAVRYLSGHTLAERRIYEMRQQPVSFDPVWAPVPDDVDRFEEKPCNAERPREDGTRRRDKQGRLRLANALAPTRLLDQEWSEGRDQHSLFNWIVHRRPSTILPEGGWLLCDDGAGEHADFVHLDPDAGVVRLIHVKAAHGSGNSISLGDFEQVVSQAIKNARWLAFQDLSERLAAPSEHLKDLVWVPDDVDLEEDEDKRARFADALAAHGERVKRHVVIVQPGLPQSKWESPSPGTEQDAHQLLSTLLFSAQATCFGLNATFTVVGAAV